MGAAVAWGLSGDLTRPLRRADDATRRIAAGDLAARLPEPSTTDRTEVADLTRSINDMAAALEHSRGLERQFLLSVSHDLRTPLTSIRGYAEAISDGTASDPGAAARVINTEAQRLGRLVGDLLDLARLDADGFTFAFQVVPVAEVVNEVAEGFRPTAEAAQVTLHLSAPAAGTTARIDPGRLGQCVANLMENGLRYAAASCGSTTGRAADGGVEVTVDRRRPRHRPGRPAPRVRAALRRRPAPDPRPGPGLGRRERARPRHRAGAGGGHGRPGAGGVARPARRQRRPLRACRCRPARRPPPPTTPPG